MINGGEGLLLGHNSAFTLCFLSPVLDLVFQRFSVIFKKAKQAKRKSDQVTGLIPQGLLTTLRIKSTSPGMSGPCTLPLPSLKPTYSVQCDGSGSSPDAFREGQWALGETCHAGILWFCDLESESHVWSCGCAEINCWRLIT